MPCVRSRTVLSLVRRSCCRSVKNRPPPSVPAGSSCWPDNSRPCPAHLVASPVAAFSPASFQPTQDRQALFLTANKTLFIAGVLEFALDAIQLVNHGQRDIGTPRLALGLHFLRIDELASDMGQARQAFHPRLQRQRVTTCVIVVIT